MAHGSKHQAPGQLRWRVRRSTTCCHQNAVTCAGFDINMWDTSPGLADELELRQQSKQRLGNFRAFPNQNQRLGIFESLCKRGGIFHRVAENRHLMPTELAETIEA